MLPVLEASSEKIVSMKEVVSELSDKFGLSEDERKHLVPSGRHTTIYSRVHWAKSYLEKAGLVRATERGKFLITETGARALASKPERIDNKFLTQFEGFRTFKSKRGTRPRRSIAGEASGPNLVNNDEDTPEEALSSAYETIKDALAADLVDRVRSSTPLFFEQIIVRLLVAMGYGGVTADPGRILGRSGDDGVDGVIDQDPLGVDQIYVQAKQYQEGNNIGAGAIREFAGALDLKKAKKGIFFTSSGFSDSARQTAGALGSRIVLIDGARLANLMIDYNIGCREEKVIKLKKIDEDFFDQGTD